MVSTSDHKARGVLLLITSQHEGQDKHTHTIVSTYPCHNLLFLLQCNDGQPLTALPMCYRVVFLKLANNLLDCRVWRSVMITKVLFK